MNVEKKVLIIQLHVAPVWFVTQILSVSKRKTMDVLERILDAKNVARNGKEPHLYAALVLYVTLVNRLVFYHDFNVLFA